jgi:hypothetical protein
MLTAIMPAELLDYGLLSGLHTKRDLRATGRAPIRRPEITSQAGERVGIPHEDSDAASRSRSMEVPRERLPRSWIDMISPIL